MTLDTSVLLPCEPRRQFHDGDSLEATRVVLDLLKAKGRADAVEQFAARDNLNIATLKITVNENFGGQLVQREIGVGELRAKAAPLLAHQRHCVGCQANTLGTPYGCYVTLHYPVAHAEEAWLSDRLEPGGSGGWNSAILFCAENGALGETSRSMRRRGFFESKRPIVRQHKVGFFKRQSVSTDQLFDLLLRGGEALVEPPLCGLICWWFGCLMVQGQVPGRHTDDPRVATLKNVLTGPPEARAETTTFALEGGPSPTGELSDILSSLYRCWLLDVPFYCWG